MLRKSLLTVICISMLVGCANRELENKKQAISSNIKQLDQQKELVHQQLIGRKQKISSLENKSNELTEDLSTLNGEVEAFLLGHITATLCMGAAGVTLDQDNEYSEKVKDISKGVTFICAIGLLDADFRQEVFDVGSNLLQVSQSAKNLKSQINSIQSKIDVEKSASKNEQSEFDRLASEIQSLQSQLSQLQ